MNQRNKGIIVSVLGSILYMIAAIAIGAVISMVSPDPWSGLVFAIFAMLLGVFILLGILIYAAVKYRKTQSQFALGAVYGIIGYFVVIGLAILLNVVLGI